MKKAVLSIFFIGFLAFSDFAQEPKLMLPIGHTASIYSAQFSADGKKVYTASVDHTAKVWDAETGKLLGELYKPTSDYSYGRLSPDGKMLMTASLSSYIAQVWDVEDGKLLANLRGQSWIVPIARFSPDDKKLVTTSDLSKTAQVWDIKTGKLLKNLQGHTKQITGIEFSPDSRRIVTASYDSTAKIWDAETGRLLVDLKGHNNNKLSSAQFFPDGKRILTVEDVIFGDNLAKVWDAQTGRQLFSLNEKDCNFACIYPDSKRIITVAVGGMAKIWNAENGAFLTELSLNGQTTVDDDVEFSPDGKKIIAACSDSTAKIWDAETGKFLTNLKGHTANIHAVQFSPDGKKIITAADDNTSKTWDAETGRLLADLRGYTYQVNAAHFSPNGKKVVTASDDNTAKIWEVETGRLLTTLRGHKYKVNTAQFSPDGKKVVTASNDETAKIWDAETGGLLNSIKVGSDWVNSCQFSPDGKKIITISAEKAKIWDTETGKLSGDLTTGSISSVQFSPDSKKLVVTYYFETAKVWDAETAKPLVDLKGPKGHFTFAQFSADSKKIVTAYDDRTVTIMDAENGIPIIDLNGHLDRINAAQFSPDGKKLVTISPFIVEIWDAKTGAKLKDLINGYGFNSAQFSPDGDKILTTSWDHATTWDAETGRQLADMKGHTGKVTSAQFSADGKMILTNSADNTCRIWNAGTGKLRYTFFAVDSTDYFNQIPSGYYAATQNAAKLLHYVTKNLEVITFDQLDIKYNRPDKVLEAIGCPDTALIHAYRKAYEKRIKKLGIDTSFFKSGYSVPKSDFRNRDNIEPEQKQDQLLLHISGSDSTYNLDRFNVWVNQVPVYGIRGISLKKGNKKTLDTTVTITLSQGDNRIETSVTDANGTESYHIPLYVKYIPDKPVDTLIHFVGIGINKFKDKNYNLSWSVKDIHDLALKFKEKYGSKCIIDTLFDENVTTANVIALKKKLLKSGVNDKVVLAYSGHGLLSKDYDYFLSTYDVNFKDPAKNGLPYDALENLLDSIVARKKLMLIDACHSGEVDKDEMNRYQQTADERKKNGLKGAEIELIEKPGMSMASSFELMKQLFVNVGKSTGATIISAAGGVQYALEKNDLKNGVFTYSILENMQKNPHVTISALKLYVNKRVTELTAGMQVPTTRNETDVVDWEVW